MGIKYISLYDILMFRHTKGIIMNEDYDAFYKLLSEIGIDTTREIEFQDVYVRSKLDHRVLCMGRWVGFERTDDAWLKSPYCSLGTRVAHAGPKDVGLMMELYRMSKVANFTGMICKHIEYGLGEGMHIDYSLMDDEIQDMLSDCEDVKKMLERNMIFKDGWDG